MKLLYCENCRFSCQATECECVCHTQNEGFNYGYKLGKKETIAKLKAKIMLLPRYCATTKSEDGILIMRKDALVILEDIK